MAKAVPPSIIKVVQKPETWDANVFESLIRTDLENSNGAITSSDELLISLLVMSMQTLIDAQVQLQTQGMIYEYNAGEAPSAWIKIRTESLDKVVKLMTELSLNTRHRNKVKPKPTEVDELFATA